MAGSTENKVLFSAILLAAGESKRFNHACTHPKTRKPFAKIAGQTLLTRVLSAFSRASGKFCRVGELILVLHRDDLGAFSQSPLRYKVDKTVPGGKLRQDSVRNGLKLSGSSFRYILVHDVARPMVSPELINRIMEMTVKYGAAVPAVRIFDTVKAVDKEGFVESTLDRECLRLIQTPQGFRKDILEKAYERLSKKQITVTDDSALAESAGFRVKLVDGDPSNVKITLKTDLKLVNRNFSKNPKFFR